MNDLVVPGALAWREYQVHLPSHVTATLSFTLGDPDHEAWPAVVARQRGALAFGMLAIDDVPDAPEKAVLWTVEQDRLSIICERDDPDHSEEVKRVLPRYFAMFFDDIKDLAPQLAAREVLMPCLGDTTLH
ncbi:hypothetical protein SAMN02745126_05575 [Enhydrobacter aerosaccus]|uniref:Uncharacterized protein n=1 Tax=Enhydrobacter aerosaccus TaxID=225324 RepID=A0A1T4T3U2_9HYPH|nr:hypothetical protein [Enhydrobacter aerosaccus]SKA34911.1 hypothetical protein SAMN02745126_05575 [Enhydrobacter aerosaccus]